MLGQAFCLAEHSLVKQKNLEGSVTGTPGSFSRIGALSLLSPCSG